MPNVNKKIGKVKKNYQINCQQSDQFMLESLVKFNIHQKTSCKCSSNHYNLIIQTSLIWGISAMSKTYIMLVNLVFAAQSIAAAEANNDRVTVHNHTKYPITLQIHSLVSGNSLGFFSKDINPNESWYYSRNSDDDVYAFSLSCPQLFSGYKYYTPFNTTLHTQTGLNFQGGDYYQPYNIDTKILVFNEKEVEVPRLTSKQARAENITFLSLQNDEKMKKARFVWLPGTTSSNERIMALYFDAEFSQFYTTNQDLFPEKLTWNELATTMKEIVSVDKESNAPAEKLLALELINHKNDSFILLPGKTKCGSHIMINYTNVQNLLYSIVTRDKNKVVLSELSFESFINRVNEINDVDFKKRIIIPNNKSIFSSYKFKFLCAFAGICTIGIASYGWQHIKQLKLFNRY